MKRTPLARTSPKRRKQLDQYRAKSRSYLRAHPRCERCGKPSQDLHHKKGRSGAMLLDEAYWCALCRPCHDLCKSEPQRMMTEGWVVDRLFACFL